MVVLSHLIFNYFWPLLALAQALVPIASAASPTPDWEISDSQPQTKQAPAENRVENRVEDRAEDPVEDPVDFRTQILPLLTQHCFECHNSRQADGDLRLDDEMAARRGGHTGSPIFGPTLEQSELYRRITATDPGYRMPKRAAPLSETEIGLFRRWIDSGASYQGQTVASATVPEPSQGPGEISPAEDFGASLLTMEGWVERWLSTAKQLSLPRFRFLNWWGWLLASWLGLVILKVVGSLVFGLRKLRAKVPLGISVGRAATESDPAVRHPLGGLNHWISWKRLLSSLLIIGCLGMMAYQRNRIQELLNQQAAAPAFGSRTQSSPPISFERSRLTLPIDPMHPPRLGGIYYRGNDERDPGLFNGGFYRTAELEVWLINAQGERIQWDDEITDQQLSIELTIRRSPGTTPELFSQRIMSTAFLRRFRETPVESDSTIDESLEIPLQVQQPDQRWSATIPLEPVADWSEGRNAGVIYLFYGPTIVDGQKGRVHYGIRYELESKDGRVTRESSLWMGSLYDLGGRVLIPQEGEVLLDHWFDFRPIPEIEGKNPDRPELLGIPEHENQWID